MGLAHLECSPLHAWGRPGDAGRFLGSYPDLGGTVED